MSKLQFTGESEVQKGVNGYFYLHAATFCELRNDPQQPYLVDLYSKRSGDSPPVRLRLNRADLMGLTESLLQLLDGKCKLGEKEAASE